MIAFTDRAERARRRRVSADTGIPDGVSVLVFPSDTGGLGRLRIELAPLREHARRQGRQVPDHEPAGAANTSPSRFPIGSRLTGRIRGSWSRWRADATRVRVRDGESVTQLLKVSDERATSFAAALAALALACRRSDARQARDQMQAPKTGTAAICRHDPDRRQQRRSRSNARRCIVINAESAFTKNAYTNDAGRFSLAGLPAGRYTLTANKPAFLRMSVRRKALRPPGHAHHAQGRRADDRHHAAHAARRRARRCHHGRKRPAGVRCLRPRDAGRMQNGERTFVPVATANLNETTDDRGAYRFFGLPPGDFVVSAIAAVVRRRNTRHDGGAKSAPSCRRFNSSNRRPRNRPRPGYRARPWPQPTPSQRRSPRRKP